MDFTEEVVNFVSSDNNTTEMKTAIIGGGAAGFFLAINLKERCPRMEVTIFERARKSREQLQRRGCLINEFVLDKGLRLRVVQHSTTISHALF